MAQTYLALFILISLASCKGGFGVIQDKKPGSSTNTTITSWGVNGSVTAITEDANILYVAGNFTHIGQAKGGGVIVDPTKDRTATNSAHISAQVSISIPDGAGGFYIGGPFTEIDGQTRSPLAHINADGSLDTGFDIGVVDVEADSFLLNYAYLRMALSPDKQTLYATDRTKGVKAFNALTGSMSGVTQYTYTVSNGTFGIVPSPDGNLLFILHGLGLEAFSTTTGLRVSNTYLGAFDNYSYLAISNDGKTIYSLSSTALEVLNYNAGVITKTGEIPVAMSNINGIALSPDGKRLFAHGSFSTESGAPRTNLAAFDLEILGLAPFDATSNFSVSADRISGIGINATNKCLYVAGKFTEIGGSQRTNLACLDFITGVPTSLSVKLAQSSSISSLSSSYDGKSLFIGGSIIEHGVARKNLAAFDKQSKKVASFNPGVTLGESQGPITGNVTTLILSPDKQNLYVGGGFTHIGDVAEKYFAALKVSDGSLLTTNYPDFSAYTHGSINEMKLSADGQVLYHHLSIYDGTDITGVIGVYNPQNDAWSSMATGINYVRSFKLSPDDSKILVVGNEPDLINGGDLTVFDEYKTADGTKTQIIDLTAFSDVNMEQSIDGTELYFLVNNQDLDAEGDDGDSAIIVLDATDYNQKNVYPMFDMYSNEFYVQKNGKMKIIRSVSKVLQFSYNFDLVTGVLMPDPIMTNFSSLYLGESDDGEYVYVRANNGVRSIPGNI